MNPIPRIPSLYRRLIQHKRVRVCRNGSSAKPVLVDVPDTFQQFLIDCSQILQDSNLFNEPLVLAWNSKGMKIQSLDMLDHNELVYLGGMNEEFYAKRQSFFKKLIQLICGQNTREGTVDDPEEVIKSSETETKIQENDDMQVKSNVRDLSKEVNKSVVNFWMDPDFDISTQNLLEMFDMFDKRRSGVIGYDVFRQGLEEFNMTNRLSDREFKELVRQIDIDQSGDIKRFEFVKAMQSMVITSRLLGTAPSKAGSLHECFVYDYSIEGFRYRSTSHPKSPLLIEEFLHEPSGPNSPHKVRWIHVVGDHIGTLLGIASKYGLNNFEIEDALSGTERSRMVEHCFDSRPWFESGGHVQIIIRVVRPKKKPPLRLKEEQLTIFCTNDTVITIQQKPNSVVFFKLQTRISGSAPKLDDEKTFENSFSSGKFVVSKIRRNGSEFLVYSIIDRIVDCANSTLYRFNKELIRLERDVNSPKDTPPNTMVQVHRVKREMATLLDCLRPLHQTVLKSIESLKIRIQRRHQVLEKGKRISEREFDGFGLDQQQVDLDIVDWNELVAGYSDIKDHIELMNAQNYQSHRMNEVMYLLTLITTFFVPAQFLTGVYGMNFDFMPELSWKYSYLLFWLLILAIGLCTYFYFKRKRWV